MWRLGLMSKASGFKCNYMDSQFSAWGTGSGLSVGDPCFESLRKRIIHVLMFNDRSPGNLPSYESVYGYFEGL